MHDLSSNPYGAVQMLFTYLRYKPSVSSFRQHQLFPDIV